MKPNPAHFSIHDVSDFPIVRFRPETAVTGYAPLWENDMDALLRHGVPFVLLFEEERSDEAHVDRKRRGLWLKHNKVALAALCRGLVSVEADAEQRAPAGDGGRRHEGVRHRAGGGRHARTGRGHDGVAAR